jgi:hypothetical protein
MSPMDSHGTEDELSRGREGALMEAVAQELERHTCKFGYATGLSSKTTDIIGN